VLDTQDQLDSLRVADELQLATHGYDELALYF
jgi:hypothetical protein